MAMDGEEYPWIKAIEDGYWHKRPLTDVPRGDADSGHTYLTICGLTVSSVHVSQSPPHETRKIYAYSHEAGCRKCVWLDKWELLIERMAISAHDAWMKTNISWGITSRLSDWGEEFMVPYEDLSERGRDLDRTIMRAIFLAINDAGYRVRVK